MNAHKLAIAALLSLAATSALADRDPIHDFDFEFGSWDVKVHRLKNPLSGSNEWIDHGGSTVAYKLLDGRANVVEVTNDAPTGRSQFLAIRLYNPESHQWALTFAHAASGTIDTPVYGSFDSGRGEFYGTDTYKGRAILVRLLFFPGADNWKSEQAFSSDGGKTWETNWVTTYKRRT